MKYIHIPSFFFCCLFNILCGTSAVFAQAATDSSRYYYDIIVNPKQSTEIIDAFIFYENKLAGDLKRGDTLAAVQGIRLIAAGQYDLGMYAESELLAVEALEYVEQLPINENTTEAKSALYNHLGRVYRSLKNYENGLYYFNKAISLANNRRDSLLLLNNRALIYMEQGDYVLAREELNLIYQHSVEANLEVIKVARALDNLGYVQSKLQEPAGLANMLLALEQRKQAKDTPGLYASYKHLSNYYKDRGNSEASGLYAAEGFAIAKRFNSASYLEDALKQLLLVSKDTLATNYLQLSDSLNTAKLEQQNKYAGIRFDFLKAQKRATEIELAREKEERLKLWYQAIGAFVLLLSFLLYFVLRSRHRKDKLQQIYNTETRISKKVHDEVANDVYHVMAKLQSNAQSQEELLDDLEGIYLKTRDISKESSAIELGENYALLLQDLLLSYRGDDVNIITRNISKVKWQSVSPAKKTILYRVLQELMTNMRKHSKATLVVLSFQQSTQRLTIDYTDNGVGSELKKQNGLQNTENRIASIQGKITFDSQPANGFKVKIVI